MSGYCNEFPIYPWFCSLKSWLSSYLFEVIKRFSCFFFCLFLFLFWFVCFFESRWSSCSLWKILSDTSYFTIIRNETPIHWHLKQNFQLILWTRFLCLERIVWSIASFLFYQGSDVETWFKIFTGQIQTGGRKRNSGSFLANWCGKGKKEVKRGKQGNPQKFLPVSPLLSYLLSYLTARNSCPLPI